MGSVQYLLLQLSKCTINVDTSLGECKDLLSSIVSERGSARNVLLAHQTQQCQVIGQRKCLVLYLPCPESEYHSGRCKAGEHHKNDEVNEGVVHLLRRVAQDCRVHYTSC